ncbi:MAG TPA: MoxR family ATPase [Armatimonadota bacterium]
MSPTAPRPVLPPQVERLLCFYLKRHTPVLLEGPPGTGKSLAARYWAQEIGDREPVKIDITEDTELPHILGDVDWKRLLMETRQTTGPVTASGAPPQTGGDSPEMPGEPATSLYDRYYVPSTAIRAMLEGRVLIIEELDRCGRDTLFPVFFDMIEYHRAYIPALQREVRAREGFGVVITVNRETDAGTVRLPDALLRRCRRLYVPMPDLETEKRIVLANLPDAPQRLVHQVVSAVQRLRELELEHTPSPSETVHWVEDLLGLFGEAAESPEPEMLQATLGAVCKSAEDSAEALKSLRGSGSGVTVADRIRSGGNRGRR